MTVDLVDRSVCAIRERQVGDGSAGCKGATVRRNDTFNRRVTRDRAHRVVQGHVSYGHSADTRC